MIFWQVFQCWSFLLLWRKQHCWHQKVRLRRATEDAYGEITVDQAAARRVYEDWLALTRFPTAQRERRPYWLLRPLKPHPDAYRRDAAP